jgi:hypothetical protein
MKKKKKKKKKKKNRKRETTKKCRLLPLSVRRPQKFEFDCPLWPCPNHFYLYLCSDP